jgi:alanine racemase
VANLTEAQVIRSVGKGWPILMLGACLPSEVSAAVRDDVMPSISNFEEAQCFSEAATKMKKEIPVHVKVDTGMGRIGVRPEQALDFLKQVRGSKGIIVQGIYTHFSSAEDNPGVSAQQLKSFRGVLKSLDQKIPVVHANNSGGLLFERQGMFNAVRPGLLVFGVIPPAQRKMSSALKQHLRPVLSWKCQVSLVKDIPKGTSLSYGQTFTAPNQMRVATVTAGYGDGYLRAGSNRAEVLIGGQRCKVLGRVTMDQMIVDVSRVPPVRAGDEVVLIGKQREDEITANELA